jgi:hypothetical protein
MKEEAYVNNIDNYTSSISAWVEYDSIS